MKRNLFLSSISVLCALLIAEGAIRILEKEPPQKNMQNPTDTWVTVPEQIWTEPHPILGWYHQKRKVAVLKKGTINVAVNTNSSGFRGKKEYQKERPPGTVRIICLGDSFVFGWGVQDEETFSAQLERRMEHGEAINLGSAGYGVDQILLSYQEIGKEFRPDYVVIGLFPEDFWRATRSYTDAGYGKPYFTLTKENKLVLRNVPVQAPAALEYRQFPNIIEYNLWGRLLFRSALYAYLRKKTLRVAGYLGWIDPDLTEEWQLGKVILKEFVREVREIGARPIILVIPPASWMNNTKLTSLQKSVRRFADRENVKVVDPTPYLIEAIGRSNTYDFYFKDDNHWTAKAHELVAEVLIRHLNLNSKAYVKNL